MRVTRAVVAEERDWVRSQAPAVVALVNDVRAGLGEAFETDVASISEAEYRAAVDEVFADGDLAVNVAALVRLLRDLDVDGDYPGFVVDEVLGRELAAWLAGGRPLSTLAEATFHYADMLVEEGATDAAGADDLEAALAAGVQTRLPGWAWADRESPFGVQ